MPRPGATPLVGRERELSRLAAGLRAARGGRAGLVLVGGEAGVGKTRLLGALADRARAEGAAVLVGHCVDLGGAGLPYLPVVEALRGLAAASAARPALAQALARHPAAQRLTGGDRAPGPEDGAVRLQLFEAVAGLLGEAGADAPVLLELEDVHWADGSTLDLLRFLGARLADERVLVVASYRTDELHRRHPLRPLLAEARRLPVVEHLEVPPFDDDELREHLTALHGGPLPGGLLAEVARRSEGNAYYAEELLAARSGGTGGPLPDGLADVLLARVERLPAPAQEVVRTVAVAGRRVGDALLQAVAGTPAVELEAALREAVAGQVLVADGEGYAFRHALLQEAVHGDLLPGERVRRHAAFAAALQGAAGAGVAAAELAHHALAARDLPLALVAAVRAADEAAALLAPGEALRQVEQALELLPAVPAAAARDALRAPLGRLEERLRPVVLAGPADEGLRLALVAAALASRCGEPERAVAHARDAAERAPAGSPAAVAARYVLVHHLTDAEHDAEAHELAREALAQDGPPSAARTWTRAALARVALFLERYDEARAAAEEGLEVARAQGLPDAEADLLATLAVLDEGAGDVAAAARHLQASLERAVAAGDATTEVRAHYSLAAHRWYAGDVAGALAALAAGVPRSAALGLAWSPYGIELRVLQVVALAVAGDLAGSERAADLAGPAGDRPPVPVLARLAAARLHAAVARGAPDAAEQVERLRDAWHHDPQIALIAGGCEADRRTAEGDLAGALDVVQEALDAVEREWGAWSLGGIWLCALGLAALADAAARARTRGDAAALARARAQGDALLLRARTTAERGRPRAGRLGPEGRAWLRRAEAEHARLVDPAAAVPAWRAALEAFGYGHAPETARTRWRLAEALLEAGEREAAAREGTAALREARALGAEPLRRAVEALLRRGRLAPVEAPAPAPAAGPLTAREAQVLALVAQGLTNRQVGSRLRISEKTASVHVSRILAKLGVASRAEAVGAAHRRGLL
ncbi:helix-turn-helix transcriptional regulator [Vallicoccus soli]|uniref:helix-turn-helix transcriptional regulator n=1 Tax=Vallicoccus soli TaxID=2339232 RepID=UPI001C498BA9|nr:LuxR family transcriptional regulator [Vallicoccus soli]